MYSNYTMSYSVPYFKEFVNTYPTFQEWKTYCEQQHVRVIDGLNRHPSSSDARQRYAILRYDKTYSNTQTMAHGFFRSVIWDTVAHRPVCVAPPKASDQTLEASSSHRCEEFLEGVMVNAFLDASGTVQLATRSKLGATGTFYSSRSFQDLLTEALQKKGIQGVQGIKDILGSHTFASFLLQHPEHRIVSRLCT